MRRKIQLYIGGQRADVADDSIILFNYALTEQEKPTAVKNSYSKQVTLPGTAANDVIFGHFAEPTRQTAFTGDGIGIGFNAGKKTPFTIYDELGQILESGYCRLDSISRKERGPCSYKVTLFGGMGSFFYALSYTGEGNKRTLADLDYGRFDLDFTINRDTLLEAWSRLSSRTPGSSVSSKWDIINFAPAYNGKPGGDFSANRGVVKAVDVGLPAQASDGSTTYYAKDGNVLVQLAKDQDEWACKDIRSYLQRPVISMRAILEACQDDTQNGGFTFDYSAVPSVLYDTLWKTLPELASLGSFKQVTGEAEVVQTSQQMSGGDPLGEYDIEGTVPQGADATLTAAIDIFWRDQAAGSLLIANSWTSGLVSGRNLMVYFFQLVAYRGNTVVGASPVKTVCAKTDWEASSLAEAVGYRPVLDKGYEGITTTAVGRESSGVRLYFFQETLNFTVQAVAPDSYKLLCGCYFVTTQYTGTGEEIRTGAQYNRAVDFGAINPTFTQPGVGDSAAEYYEGRLYESTLTFTSASSMRSGAIIPASQLLTSAHTPAEYLVSFAKTFGLLFVYDNAEKKVSLVPRNGFFTGEVMDLTNRVQRLKEVTITPQVRSAKWYVFDPSTAEGDFAKEYKSVYGVDYGAQKVDTGYEFDAADQKLLDGYAFRGAAAVLKNGPYWNMIFDGTGFRPSPFVDKGNQYTMWSVPGDTHSFPVPCPPSSVTVNYYNTVNVGYDLPAYPKLDLVDNKGNAVDGVDILVYYGGFGSYPYFKITDDDEAMVACNDGNPCWNLNPGTAAGVSLPCFTRYADFVPDGTVTRSLDFGIPRELDIPRIAISPTLGSLYLRYWQAYLSDRLHTDTKVLKCRVDFSGLQVGQGLLRKFFYYQGAYWVLNKITNYSLTTYDPTECEFVQVQDMGNYTNGQTL